MKRYVILGGSIAGVSCVEGIRRVDLEGEITLVCAEKTANYGRPLISYYLEGKTDLARMSWRGADFFEKNRVRVLTDTRAERLDAQAKQVVLSSGETLGYDAVCLCVGSYPFSPRMEGVETVAEKHSFFTLEDALALEKTVTPEKRVLIVGAGFIGLKCAEGLRDRVGSVTVCDLADHAMSAVLDGESAPILERHLARNGVRLLLGDTAERFEGQTARMKSGECVPFDVLVIAVGVRPNTALYTAAGGEAGRGVPVDGHMRTALDGVWAAGDCTESRDVTTGETAVLAVLPNAGLQGFCAGVNMAGGDRVFDRGLRMNSIGFFGLHVMSAGTYTDCVWSEITETGCRKLFAKDGVLTGFILIGDVQCAGIYTAMLRERTPLESVDFETLKRAPSLMPFGRAYRAEKLGGVV
jgi:NADPH-dependent 2,4-dienoyl-CoA reductase/sulfur reductase-like enzyme